MVACTFAWHALLKNICLFIKFSGKIQMNENIGSILYVEYCNKGYQIFGFQLSFPDFL